MDTPAPRVYTAWFPTVACATDFETRLGETGMWVTNVVRKGRTVTFEGDIPEMTDPPTPAESFMDHLEMVGYYGSSQARKAKLNGVPAPITY